MRWERGTSRGNIEDRRSGGISIGGGGVRLGLGGMAILLVLSLLTGKNFFAILGPGGGLGVPTEQAGEPYQPTPQEEEMVDFVSFVLNDVQDAWGTALPRGTGQQYQDARLVLFNGTVQSGCGYAQSQMGPFYCPLDQRVYIDLGFYQEMKNRFGAPGDFAQAYVLAHEVGHHVQNLLGIAEKVHELRQTSPEASNALSVRMELQADCLAGVWGHSTAQRDLLEKGDVEEGLGAAAAIGDDHIQSQSGRRVNPESFTHGSSAQRVAWFRRGLESGDPRQCDTFGQADPR
ncbi:MAG: zinc metallopeptidase [Gammaproteobacteria bacterium]|nr:zinc metallopeptidase [Gammaproteobacteria bacterium]